MQKTIVNLLITASLFLFVTVLGIVGFGFIIAGVHLLLAAHLTSWAAALLTGCAMLLSAIVVLLVFRLAGGREEIEEIEELEEREPHGSPTQPEAGQKESRNDELFELAIHLGKKSNLNARDATLLALIAGTVVGVSPGLRRQVLEIFNGPEDWTG